MINGRIIKIIDARLPKRGAFTQLEAQTGISAQGWRHVYHGRTSPDAKHLEQLCKVFPEYTLWLMTGKVAPEAGQTSPDLEQLQELQKAVGN